MSEVNDWNAKVIEELRASGGKLGGPFEGVPVLLLHTTGAKTGAARVNPVVYLDHDGHRYVFASKGGADTNPDWFHNLVANPAVRVEDGTETYDATAVAVSGDERTRIYDIQARRQPQFREYQSKTDRVIPVVELRRS